MTTRSTNETNHRGVHRGLAMWWQDSGGCVGLFTGGRRAVLTQSGSTVALRVLPRRAPEGQIPRGRTQRLRRSWRGFGRGDQPSRLYPDLRYPLHTDRDGCTVTPALRNNGGRTLRGERDGRSHRPGGGWGQQCGEGTWREDWLPLASQRWRAGAGLGASR